ncbi:MAG TPA: hypothetical protein VJ890_27350 [Vineibacter sp.]|nr:hypothetical protein [Vineibacter sp.]
MISIKVLSARAAFLSDTVQLVLSRMSLAVVLGCAMTAAPAAANEPLPIPTIDFEAEYNVRGSLEDMATPMTIRHSSGWYRFDSDHPQPQLRTYGFSREGTVGGIFILEVGNARLGMRILSLAGYPVYDLWGKRGTPIGEADVDGDRCGLWRVVPDAVGVTSSQRLIMCLGADAVPLYVAWEHRPKQPLFRAVTVQRRPQNLAWFSIPPGVRLRDVADMAAFEREVAVWAKSVATPKPRK